MPFDTPVFKMLSHNDTGGAPGHQGGVLVPKDLESYFPSLSAQWTAANPTVSSFIDAELFNGAVPLAKVQTRYQYQTWGAKRRPERRLTGNLGELRSRAKEDDILLVEREQSKSNTYRVTLVKKGSVAYQDIVLSAPGRRWGFLQHPVSI